MDTSNLRNTYQKLIDFLVKNGYKKSALCWTRKCIRLVLEGGESPVITSYEDLFYLEVEKRGYKAGEKRYESLKSSLGRIWQFDLEGKFPGGAAFKTGFLAPKPLYSQLNTVFQSAIDIYLANGGIHGKKEKTVRTEAGGAMNFFKHLQDNGAKTFLDIEDKMVYTFFFNGEKQIRGKSYRDMVKAVLKTGITVYGESIQKIIEMLPAIKASRKNFQYLTSEESIKIRECLENKDSGLTHLERFVGWLLYFSGLRGTDITKLKFENIDWLHDQIRLVQSKTGEPLSLPLNAAIGNELFDYISEERAPSELKTIILSKVHPFNERKSLGDLVKKIFKTAGVRSEGGARGLRVLRHHLVTYLLSHGVECDVVSSIVGHASPESLKPYADADIEHLRECSISVEAFPITNKLFEI